MKIDYLFEVWRDIKGYEGLYQVSNLGRVKSLGNDKTRKEKILKPGNNGRGYLIVILCKDGKVKTYLVHRLVAIAFLPNPNNLPEINHISEDKQKNFVWINPDGTVVPEKSNLEWCTSKYNLNYGSRNKKAGEKLTNRKDLSKPVLQYDLDGNLIREWPSSWEIQRQLGFLRGNISACCRGKYNQAYGFIWQYN